MSAGKNYAKARAQAQAIANHAQSPRWLYQYSGAWWISETPTTGGAQIDPRKKSSAQIKREIDEVLARKPGSSSVYGGRADELNAMTIESEAQQSHQPLRTAIADELHRLQSLPEPSNTQVNIMRDLEIALGLTSAKPQTVAAAWKRAQKALGR